MTETSETGVVRPRPHGRTIRAIRALTALALGVLAAAACSTDTGDRDADGADTNQDGADRTILVFAAASLTDVMVEAEQRFEAINPTIDVTVNLAGSASLRTQILEGAPADVVATANPAIMDDLVGADRIAGQPVTLATNRLVIAIAPGNPADVVGLEDLADPTHFVGLCASEVPCGDLADRAIAAAGITVDPDTREPDVRSLLTKVEAGELDAGLVYATDVTASTADVTAIELPAGLPITTGYPIAAVADGADPAAAEAFLAFLSGPEGRRILTDNGFELP